MFHWLTFACPLFLLETPSITTPHIIPEYLQILSTVFHALCIFSQWDTFSRNLLKHTTQFFKKITELGNYDQNLILNISITAVLILIILRIDLCYWFLFVCSIFHSIPSLSPPASFVLLLYNTLVWYNTNFACIYIYIC